MEVAKPLVKPGISRILSRFNVLIFALALFFTLWSMAFSPVKYYTIFGMVVMVGSLCYYIYRKTGSRGVLVLMGAVGVGILSAIIFSFEWGLSPWFNHNDISHVILTFSAFSVYKGAVLIMEGSIIGSWISEFVWKSYNHSFEISCVFSYVWKLIIFHGPFSLPYSYHAERFVWRGSGTTLHYGFSFGVGPCHWWSSWSRSLDWCRFGHWIYTDGPLPGTSILTKERCLHWIW